MWVYLLAAAFIGFAFSFQPVINASIGAAVGSPMIAAVVSVLITLVCLLLLLPVFTNGDVRLSALPALPWWSVVGGMIGVLIVAGGLTVAPVTGAAMFFVCVVAGQLFGATIIDHFGFFGFARQSLSFSKLAGLLLVLGGALLVRLSA